MAEFLPLCDVLFNVISLAGYFCDVVFDIVFGYALFEQGKIAYFVIVMVLVISSLIISQVVSLRWYLNKISLSGIPNKIPVKSQNSEPATKKQAIDQLGIGDHQPNDRSLSPKSRSKTAHCCIVILHFCQMGIVWRYAKLFVPVDLRQVKHEVRDLCMLRLVHAFCEAAPMLLLQLYVLVTMHMEDYYQSLPELKQLTGSTGPVSTGTSGSSGSNCLDCLERSGDDDVGGGTGGSSGFIRVVSAVQPRPIQIEQQQEQLKSFEDLNIVSAVLSLFSVCWALSSFSKNVRLQNVHRLVLTWLGVIFQFLWRLGTIISRITALTVYASFYSQWIFLVIILHWMSMFLWLISPKNVFHGERISKRRKGVFAAMIAFVYVFAYINLQEVNHRQKMIIFYVVMFLENWLLVGLWLVGIWPGRPDNWYLIPTLVFCSFFIGMTFMLLYYRFFHVRRLCYEAGGRLPACNGQSHKTGMKGGRDSCQFTNGMGWPSKNGRSMEHQAIPGVFNCRFSNPVGSATTKRKKKKPTTFVPPPALRLPTGLPTTNNNNITDNKTEQFINHMMPFWRRPISVSHSTTGGGSSENEGSAGSRVNIYQKLQEKKQKQLAELKVIEEEIKQGKLGGPAANIYAGFTTGGNSNGGGHITNGSIGSSMMADDFQGSLPRQPIPRQKKHINLDPMEWRQSINSEAGTNLLFTTSSLTIDEVNEPPQRSDQFEQIRYEMGVEVVVDIPLLRNNITALRNMSPISSQLSATESNSLTRRQNTKISHDRSTIGFNDLYPYDGNQTDRRSTSPQKIPHTGNMDAHLRQQISNSSGGGGGGFCVVVDEQYPSQYPPYPPPRKFDSGVIVGKDDIPVAMTATKLKFQRSHTPEILLSPHSLHYSNAYGGDWLSAIQNPGISSCDENNDECIYGADGSGGGRAPSDIDSQVSLPRSYTLPREFKYYRRNRGRKLIRNEHFITSTNSSDADVDSGDDIDSDRCTNHHQPINPYHLRTRDQSSSIHHNHLSTTVNPHQVLLNHSTILMGNSNPATVSPLANQTDSGGGGPMGQSPGIHSSYHNRPMRIRGFINKKMVGAKHETKL